jgi:outer membrane immunogenic protein
MTVEYDNRRWYPAARVVSRGCGGRDLRRGIVGTCGGVEQRSAELLRFIISRSVISRSVSGMSSARTIAAAILAIGWCGLAQAADVAVDKAKPPAPAPLLWNGCYGGGNLGGVGIRNSEFDPSGFGDLGGDGNSGVVAGGQFGCNYQIGSFVVGGRVLFDADNTKSLHSVANNPTMDTISNDNKYFATATGRFGYAPTPEILVYGQGGAAWTRNDIFPSLSGSTVDIATDKRMGYTGGAGVEYMFAPDWSFFVEYDYLAFGTKSVNFDQTLSPENVTLNAQMGLIGLNWHVRPW